MDPQKLSQLDPKLRDAYQRVMGTVIPEPQSAPAPTQTPPPAVPNPTPAPQINPQPEPIPSPAINEPAPSISEPPTEQSVINPQPQAANFIQMNSEIPTAPAAAAPIASTPNFTAPIQTQTIAVKKKNNILTPILFGIATLVFIAIYTLFWTKIFNFKLPFIG